MEEVTELIKKLQDKDQSVRRAAVEALGELKDARALIALSEPLWDESWKVRWAAAGALGKVGSSSVPALTKAQGAIKDARAIPALSEAIQDESWKVRLAAVKALGEIKNARVIPTLSEALHNKDTDVRQVAAKVLVEIGSPSVPALIKVLKRWIVEPDVLRASAVALGTIATSDPVPALRAALPILRRLRNSDEPAFQEALERIEAATDGMKDLPVPAAAPPPSAKNLPRPADAPVPSPETLPIPSAARVENIAGGQSKPFVPAARSRPGWLDRWRG